MIATAASADEKSDFFEAKVRPLLIEHCYECHSAEHQSAEGGLLLDSQPAMQSGGSRGNVISLNEGPDKSLLWHAVSYADNDLQMPPTGKLNEADLETIRTWLADGAYDPHIGLINVQRRANRLAMLTINGLLIASMNWSSLV
jgi:hypothetical protein